MEESESQEAGLEGQVADTQISVDNFEEKLREIIPEINLEEEKGDVAESEVEQAKKESVGEKVGQVAMTEEAYSAEKQQIKRKISITLNKLLNSTNNKVSDFYTIGETLRSYVIRIDQAIRGEKARTTIVDYEESKKQSIDFLLRVIDKSEKEINRNRQQLGSEGTSTAMEISSNKDQYRNLRQRIKVLFAAKKSWENDIDAYNGKLSQVKSLIEQAEADPKKRTTITPLTKKKDEYERDLDRAQTGLDNTKLQLDKMASDAKILYLAVKKAEIDRGGMKQGERDLYDVETMLYEFKQDLKYYKKLLDTTPVKVNFTFAPQEIADTVNGFYKGGEGEALPNPVAFATDLSFVDRTKVNEYREGQAERIALVELKKKDQDKDLKESTYDSAEKALDFVMKHTL